MPKTERLNLRLSDEDDRLIRRAAEVTHRNMSEFVLGSAREAAQQTLADRMSFELDHAAWQEFNALLERPVSPDKRRLARLLAEPDRFE